VEEDEGWITPLLCDDHAMSDSQRDPISVGPIPSLTLIPFNLGGGNSRLGRKVNDPFLACPFLPSFHTSV